ncbi:MAG: PHB depolymerase family esterase [Bacteroidota bacterium]
MKKLESLLLFFLIISQFGHAQVGINATGALPDASAILDVKSNNKGLLIPRISLTSITDNVTIPNPALSLMVFNTNASLPEGSGYYGWNGSMWVLIKALSASPVIGANQFFIPVDGVSREFWVHVPISYNPANPTPLVIMLHGTSGNGYKFYDESGWKELGDEENIITVFPSSGRYDITYINDGSHKRTTKWNTVPDAEWIFDPGQTPLDDIKFLKNMITAVKLQLNIDPKRVYLEGFSNGGSMASKCGVEMSDILAAVCSNAGSFYLDNITYMPLRLLPMLFQVGNQDYGPGNFGPTVPLSTFEYTLDNQLPMTVRPAEKNYNVSHSMTRHFALNPAHGSAQIVMNPDSTKEIYRYVDYVGLSGQPNNVYRHIFVDDLAHKFPNEFNFRTYDAPREHWKWMKQFVLP